MTSNTLWQPQRRFVRKDSSPEGLTAPKGYPRKQRALLLCSFAKDRASWLLADKLARAWACGGCQALGVQPPE